MRLKWGDLLAVLACLAVLWAAFILTSCSGSIGNAANSGASWDYQWDGLPSNPCDGAGTNPCEAVPDE